MRIAIGIIVVCSAVIYFRAAGKHLDNQSNNYQKDNKNNDLKK